jgi:hypothetical protein
MKKILLPILLLSLFLAGCAKFSTTDVQTALTGQSYLMTDANQQQVPIAFEPGCIVNYRWDYSLMLNHWEVKAADGKIVLDCDDHVFTANQTTAGDFEFLDEKRGEKMVKLKDVPYSAEQLLGEWMDSYASMVKGVPGKGSKSPCPALPQDSFLIPKVVFSEGKCVLQDYCTQTTKDYMLNANHGFILFGNACDSLTEQWKIKKLTANELVVDIRSIQNGAAGFEYGKRFFKP